MTALSAYDATSLIARHLVAMGADKQKIAATLRQAAERTRAVGNASTAAALDRVVRELSS